MWGGHRQEQETHLQLLQQLAQTLKSPAAQAVVHIRQCAYETIMGNFDDAAAEAQAALVAARKAGRAELESETYIYLATLDLHHGALGAAREHLYAAKNDLVEVEYRHIEAKRLNGLGVLYRHLNNHTESTQYFSQAATLSEVAGDRHGQAQHLSNLADMLLNTGQFSTALRYQHWAMVIAQITGERAVEARCLNRMAKAYGTVGSFSKAQFLIEQARRIHRELEDDQGQAADLRVMGKIHLNNQDYVLARDYVGQALEMYQRSRNRLEERKTWLALGLCLEGLGHTDKARHAFQQAQDISTAVDEQIVCSRCSSRVGPLLAHGRGN